MWCTIYVKSRTAGKAKLIRQKFCTDGSPASTANESRLDSGTMIKADLECTCGSSVLLRSPTGESNIALYIERSKAKVRIQSGKVSNLEYIYVNIYMYLCAYVIMYF